MQGNLDQDVVTAFGEEWKKFDQSSLSRLELELMFDNYFHLFPWSELPPGPVGFDLGCGTGRWARFVAPRVRTLHLIDPSDAIEVACRNLREYNNCIFHRASVDSIPLEDGSCDFGYSLGVLHHVPDTAAGIRACVQKLKPGAPFLIYLYYRFDNRPAWFRAIWKLSDIVRRTVCRLPFAFRYLISQIIALMVYFPLARLSYILEKLGFAVERLPLAQYRRNSFYTMRTDALDRFGTRIEKRFTKDEIRQMLEECGLERITFSDRSYWTAVAFKRLS